MAEPSGGADLRTLQYAFAGHIRDPQGQPCPADVPDRRMQVYRELFFNNVENFLAEALPVLRRITPDPQWQALVRDFLARHRAHSPYFLDIPREFLSYLDEQRPPHPHDWPFLRDLAHYEWVELALATHEAEPAWCEPRPDQDPLDGRPQLSPLAWPLAYAWPVHRIGPDHLPQAPAEAPTYLLVYRDREDQVHFMELNPVSARLIALIQAQPACTGREAAQQIAEELGHPDPQIVHAGAAELLRDWWQRGVLLDIG